MVLSFDSSCQVGKFLDFVLEALNSKTKPFRDYVIYYYWYDDIMMIRDYEYPR